MTKLNVRPREVRIWYKSDGSIEWKARVLKPSEIAMMGVVLQDGALRTLREVTPDGPKRQVIVYRKCPKKCDSRGSVFCRVNCPEHDKPMNPKLSQDGKTKFKIIRKRTKVPNYDGPIPESDKQ